MIYGIHDGQGNDVSNNSNHIANINPYRYRGYYYDVETQLYYLNSRYYNQDLGRFINADSYVATGNKLLSHNMYIYADNNPVNMIDPDGEFAIAIIGMIVGITVGTAVAIKEMVEIDKEKGKLTFVDWFGAVSNGAGVSVAISSFGFFGQSMYDTSKFNFQMHKISRSAHGNSLLTNKPTQGYVLFDQKNGSILKYGETTRGYNRYSPRQLSSMGPNGARMEIINSGTKFDMHKWQNNMILDYKALHNGERPMCNFSDW